MQKLVIKKISARKILDSRGNPTIEVEVVVRRGRATGTGRAAAPSGVSRGKHEVVAFPSGGPDASIELVRKTIASKLVGRPVGGQEELDSILHELDGTSNFSKLGGNAAVAISMAVAKAAASTHGMPLYRYLGDRRAVQLPYPLGNVLGGGAHAGRYAPDIQEFISAPVGASSFLDAAFANSQVHKKVRDLLEQKDKTFTGGKGDEGAWAPNLNNEDSLEVVAQACDDASSEFGFEIRPALDVAASRLYDEKKDAYIYERSGKTLDRGEQLDFIIELIDTYKLFYVEDPLHEEDFDGFAELTSKVGKKCLICGDDLFTTNVARLQKGIKAGAANAVIIKPNQIGTLSDTLAAIKVAKKHDYIPVMSHRSGETHDETIANLAVGWGCPLVKTGVVGSERMAKLNELIRIEQELGEKARMGRLR
ncbi:MAG: phosphopyruvate hydratase [Candidatus Hodarchaeaceae archaeon]|nr:phosphopyruvate hydratase [Candidatus Hodarchaeaceae archaeon]